MSQEADFRFAPAIAIARRQTGCFHDGELPDAVASLLGSQKTATELRNLVLSLAVGMAAMNCRVCSLLSEKTASAADDTSSHRHNGSYLGDRRFRPGGPGTPAAPCILPAYSPALDPIDPSAGPGGFCQLSVGFSTKQLLLELEAVFAQKHLRKMAAEPSMLRGMASD